MHHHVLASVHPEQVEVEIWRADALEVRRGLSSALDDMWSFVQAKAHPRWLWHAMDHHTGQVLAYMFGRRKDAVFLKLQQLLVLCQILFGAYDWRRYAEPRRCPRDVSTCPGDV